MDLGNIPYLINDWEKIEKIEYKGETGTSYWRTVQTGDLRVRIVEYSSGYLADHWCSRGHVLQVIDGELINEFQDGSKTVLKKGMGFVVGDDERNQHRVYTENGAVVFIVD